MLGTLTFTPAIEQPQLLAAPVAALLKEWPIVDVSVQYVLVAPIDPILADTAEFCAHYQVSLEQSANCVIVAGTRAGRTTYAACVVLATTRADINNVVRRQLGARKASFAPMDYVTAATGMEYGGITPLGLPSDWPILVDSRVAETPMVIIGSGLRASKIALPGQTLGWLPQAKVLDDLVV